MHDFQRARKIRRGASELNAAELRNSETASCGTRHKLWKCSAASEQKPPCSNGRLKNRIAIDSRPRLLIVGRKAIRSRAAGEGGGNRALHLSRAIVSPRATSPSSNPSSFSLFRPSLGPRTTRFTPRLPSEPYISQDSCPVMINNVSRKRKSFSSARRGERDYGHSRHPKHAPRDTLPRRFRRRTARWWLKFRCCRSRLALKLSRLNGPPFPARFHAGNSKGAGSRAIISGTPFQGG